MKAVLTIIATLFIGTLAMAQDNVKVETVTAPVVLNVEIADTVSVDGEQVARLYRRPNARVNKALSFTTKRNRSKLA